MPMRPKTVRVPFNMKRAVPHMSWHVENLYNIWQRTDPLSRLAKETNFNQTQLTIFQQRWRSKRLTKGYHAEHLGAKAFERWFLPEALPRVRSADGTGAVSSELSKWVEGREAAGGRTALRKKIAEMEQEASSPVGTLMFTEVERRIDTLVFRACFATSVWQARAFVVQGHVKINGRVVRNANILLKPGDIFSVDPKIVPMLAKPTAEVLKAATVEVTEESAAEESAEAEASAEASAEVEATVEATESAEVSAEATETVESSESSESADSSAKASSTPTTVDKSGTPFTSTIKDTHFTLPDYAAPHLFVPAYLLPSYLTCSAVYIRHPTARPGYSEIPSPYDAGGNINSLTWEWYQRVAPRMRPNRRARLMNPQRTQDRK